MAPYFEQLVATGVLSADESFLQSLQTKNKDELATLDETLEDARTNLGESEISDALRAKALYLAKIGEKVRGTVWS